MARRGSKYSDEELASLYERYARLKGWSTKPDTIRSHIEAWRASSLGPMGLAIKFHESNSDGANEIGLSTKTVRNPLIRIERSPVRGTHYPNDDGSSRYAYIRLCKRGDRMKLVAEPTNRYDKNAIKVLTTDNKQVGYIPAEAAIAIANFCSAGRKVFAAVESIIESGPVTNISLDASVKRTDVTTSTEMRICLFIAEPSVSHDDVDRFISSALGPDESVARSPPVQEEKKSRASNVDPVGKVIVRCIHCGKAYQLRASIVGRTAKCAGCKREFTIKPESG